jgi:hypothetical protein
MRSARKFLVLPLAAALLLGMVVTTAVPVAADSPTQTTTLLSGDTTLTAGYTYSNPGYEVNTYVSGSSTDTAGATTTNPSADPLNVNSYGGSWSSAQIPNSNPSPWTTVAGASWVSTTSANSGVETANEGDAWRLFRATFGVPDATRLTAASVQIAADNAYEFYLNGSKVDSTANWTPQATVYGPAPGSGGSMDPFQKVATYTLTPQSGTNTLMFVVRNWDNSGQANPSGLIYKVRVEYSKEEQLNAGVYSGGGNWTNAVLITTLPDPWVKPDWGAKWVSTTADYSGADNDYKGDAWRLFKDELNIPAGATINSASIQLTADNTFEVYSNGVQIASTEPMDTVYGAAPSDQPWPRTPPYPFQSVNGPYDFTNSVKDGTNTLMFVVRNWGNGNNSNPTGLIYKAVVQYTLDTEAPVVTITSPADNGVYNSGTVPPAGYTVTDNLDQNPTVVIIGYGTEEGVHTMAVTATDAAGNVGAASITYLVDNTPPDILINSPVDKGIYKLGTLPAADYSVVDDYDSNPTVTVDGYSANLGTHTMTVTATDAAGNVGTASVTYLVSKNPVVSVDKTPPVITIRSPKAKTYYTYDILKIHFGVQDKDSGVASYQATLDGTLVKKSQTIDLSNIVGSHTFTVTAKDKVGNVATKSVNFNVAVGVLKARIEIMPDTINLKSKSDKNAVTAIIDLPRGRGENQIDVSTVRLNINGTLIAAKLPGPKEKCCAFIVKFDRQQVINALTGLSNKFPFKVTVTVTGTLKDGTQFSGKDNITVISQGNKK